MRAIALHRTIPFILLGSFFLSSGPVSAQPGPGRETISGIRNELAAVHSLRSQEDRLVEARRIEGEIRSLLKNSPDDPELIWWAIAAMGLQVDHESNRGKIDRTREIHVETDRLRTLAPHHAGGEHAMGRLHAGVMRLNRVLRFLAVRLIGGELLRQASWEAAEAHFRRAVDLDPGGSHHRFELAVLLVDREKTEEARAILRELAAEGPAQRSQDSFERLYRTRARDLLSTLRQD